MATTRAMVCSLLACGGLWALLPFPAAGQASGPDPRYEVIAADAVTADNAPVAFAHPAGGCPPERPCPLPDANPPDRLSTVDSYTADVYERPTVPAAGGPVVVPSLDIVSARVGTGGEYLDYRIDLFATEADGRLPHAYAFELDYDDDAAGDLLVTVAGQQVGPEFGTRGVVAFWNQNSNIAGPSPGPDGPGATPDGYEVPAFDQGANRLPGKPGGADALVARVAPDRPASIELAARRSLLTALNAGEAVVKASFRPGASVAGVDAGSYNLHDRFGRAEVGSPFPFLASPGAPATCPTTDRGLPPAGRAALDSGTGTDTGRPNPCYPGRAVSGYDNAAFVSLDSGSGAGLLGPGQQPPDLAVSATHRGDLGRGGRVVLTVAVRNVGSGPTGAPVTLTDRLPAGLRPVAVTGRAWACSIAGRTVSCATRLPLAPGATSKVEVTVAVGGGGTPQVTNRADVATVGDARVANNAAADVARLASRGGLRPSPLLAVAAATALVFVVARRRRRSRLSEPGTPRSCP